MTVEKHGRIQDFKRYPVETKFTTKKMVDLRTFQALTEKNLNLLICCIYVLTNHQKFQSHLLLAF